MASEIDTRVTYSVKGDRGIWDSAFYTPESGRAYLEHIRKLFDKSAKLYKVTERWEVCDGE